MIDFDAIRKDQREWKAFASNIFIPGIDPADLKTGQRITISPNLIIGDRSYTREVHEVLAVNSSHVQTKIKRGFDGSPQIVILLVHEHHFYDATNFVEGE